MTSPLHCILQALVNQVAATIYARFHRKKLPAGKAVYGVFTRDYQYNTLNSQVIVVKLVTNLLNSGRHPFPSSLYVLPLGSLHLGLSSDTPKLQQK